MAPFERALRIARTAAAALMLASLGGLGPRWLPPAGILIVILLDPAVVDRISSAYASYGRGLGLAGLLRRRWFEASLVVVALTGLGIRLVGIDLGVGHEWLGIDENRLAESVLGYLRSGTLEHRTSEDHPGVHFWLLVASGVGTYLWALMTGLARTLDDTPVDLFVWAGRVTSAVLATGTTLLTGLVGRAVAGPAAGLIAAGVLVISPLSLETSTELRNDVAMVLFVMASAYVAQVTFLKPRRFSAVSGGLIAGCAAGIKITAVFAFLPVALAAAIPWRGRQRWRNLALCAAGFVAAVAITNHFIWSDTPNFLRQVSMDYGHVRPGHFAFTSTPRQSYLSLLGEYAVGWPLLLCAAGFAVHGLASGNRRVWLLLAFPVPYLWFMTLKYALFPRWLYVLVPFAAVAGAAGLLHLAAAAGRVSKRLARGPLGATMAGVAVAVIAIAVLAPLLWPASVQISRRFTTPTYALAEAWLAKNVPSGDLVLSETGELDLSRTGLQVVRVDDLTTALAGPELQLRGCRWIVVPEPRFQLPGLKRLFLVREFAARFGFGGNRGLDVRIYVPQARDHPPQ